MRKKVYDVVGIGFGPAGVALCAAVDDRINYANQRNEKAPTALFVEKAGQTIWQDGLLLPGTHINHHLLKDLVTPRNPSSPYSFSMYLQEKGRFYDFCLWGGAPSRIEWSDYVSWVAEKLAHYAEYNNPCRAVSRGEDGKFIVSTENGDVYAKNVVLSAGLEPHIPEPWRSGHSDNFTHSAQYLNKMSHIKDLLKSGRKNIAVIGSGLSAAEVVADLSGRFSHTEIKITSIQRSAPFRHGNTSEFSNDVYSANSFSEFYQLPEDGKKENLRDYHSTNYSGVLPHLVTSMWKSMYEANIQGRNNITILGHQIVEAIESKQGSSELAVLHKYSGETTKVKSDFSILCTGYEDSNPEKLLAPICSEILRERDCRPQVTENFKLGTVKGSQGAVYLNGHSEANHGIADSQSFSLLAHRAGLIENEIFGTAESRKQTNPEARIRLEATA